MKHNLYVIVTRCEDDMGLVKDWNGFTDSRQVITWSYNGEEVMRSEGGKRTYTETFKKLVLEYISRLFDEDVSAKA